MNPLIEFRSDISSVESTAGIAIITSSIAWSGHAAQLQYKNYHFVIPYLA